MGRIRRELAGAAGVDIVGHRRGAAAGNGSRRALVGLPLAGLLEYTSPGQRLKRKKR